MGTRVVNAGAIRYERDALGRTTLRQEVRLSRKPDTWRDEWDAEDRLTGVVTPDGTVPLFSSAHCDPGPAAPAATPVPADRPGCGRPEKRRQ
ncbi:hypothetical protein SUDANB120_06292 (plasmid) [Streptomyces sp. enrichment culture]